MQTIFNRKKYCIYAPISGQLMKLSQVTDSVFASGMMGEGLAILPSDSLVVAPADGEIILVSKTKHAFGMRLNSGIELLVHVGLNTSYHNGKGFDMLVKEGDKVHVGTPIMRIDTDYFAKVGANLETPIIILDKKEQRLLIQKDKAMCRAGETIIMSFKG
jgi:glucose-specific phosphotransferase system IIA component